MDNRKVLAFGIDAGNDRNGNPRRGWFIYSRSGDYLGFVDEGYSGWGALRRHFPNAIELANRFPTTPRAYKDALAPLWLLDEV